MATIEITTHNFRETVNGHSIVLIDYHAEWCGPCKVFGPIFERAAESHPEIVFGKVDTEKESDLVTALRVQAIPTLMVFRDQELVFSQPGLMPLHALEALIQRVKDMNIEELKEKSTSDEQTKMN